MGELQVMNLLKSTLKDAVEEKVIESVPFGKVDLSKLIEPENRKK